MATTSRTSEPTSRDKFSIVGARSNNLKNISIEIPRNQLVVITGPSGSGKSSLAFDTLYAEGQRQYAQSLSVFARKLLDQLPRPRVDEVRGIQPSLCLDQSRHRPSKRSTVGTITELYDYLRLLMARVGAIHCYGCGEPIEQSTPLEIRDRIMALPADSKLMVLAPIAVGKTGAQREAIQQVRREGLVRLRIDGDVCDIEQLPVIDPAKPHTVEAVTDRIIIRPGSESRLLEAIDNAVRISGEGRVTCCWQMKGANRDEWNEKSFSTRYACANCDIYYSEVQPRNFSFNSPFGACPTCAGQGQFTQFNPNSVLKQHLSLQAGAVVAWQGANLRKNLKALQPTLSKLHCDLDTPLNQLSTESFETLFSNRNKDAPSISVLLEKELATSMDDERMALLETYQDSIACHDCHGSRVSSMARSVLFGQRNIGDWVKLAIADLPEQLTAACEGLEEVDREVASPLVEEMIHRLTFLNQVGVGYLTLGRTATTLSGGEHQRVRLASSIGAGVTSVLFVLDEPSSGLHARDTQRLIQSLQDLKARGNSLVVVEHDEDMMRTADWLVDIGPGAGELGGQVTAAGTWDELLANPASITGQSLAKKKPDAAKETRPVDAKRVIQLRGASGNNLKNLDIDFPLNVLCCISGVSGSGKSTLVNDTLAPAVREHLELATASPAPFDSICGHEALTSLVVVDQKPIGRTPRACPATFCGLMDPLRKIFAATKKAKQLGFGIARFSYNSKTGWCPDCRGLGHRKIEMTLMPDVFVRCESCRGQRYNLQTLQVRFAGLTIADTLSLTIEEARDQFGGFSQLHARLNLLCDVGLGYLRLGQSATTLSGGEAQRIKLANELGHSVALKESGGIVGKRLFVLDEPTRGLHFVDIEKLLDLFHRLVDEGNSLIVVEHHLALIRAADWVIDLGPEGGDRGGKLLYAGKPNGLMQQKDSATGRALAR